MAVGRDNPCPCGSGRKFKRCCIGAASSKPVTLNAGLLQAAQARHDHDAAAALLDRVARTMAARIAAAGNSVLDHETRGFLADNPECLFYFLEGFLRAANSGHGVEEAEQLADAYCFLIELQLSMLHRSLDSGNSWARQIRDDFEARIVQAIREGAVSAEWVLAIAEIFRKQKIHPGPELELLFLEACEQAAGTSEPPDPISLCAEIAARCDNNPFLVSDVLYSSMRSAGPVSSELVGALFAAAPGSVKEGIALGVLDSDSQVRTAVANALVRAADAVTPNTLRRLIAVRRWLPEAEREPLDQAVRAARLAGVECAQWQSSGAAVVEMRVSSPDGAGAQMAMVVSSDGGGYRLSGILFKSGAGIADAWTSDPQSMRDIKELLGERSSDVHLLRASRRYLDLMVGYYLKDALKNAEPPPARLLELAEYLQASNWQPVEPGWQELLADLVKEVPYQLLASSSVNSILATSAKWGMKRKWAQSWAEGGDAVEDLLSRLEGRADRVVYEEIIERVLEKRRDVWAERFTLTALWMKEAPKCSLPWENFAILAHKMVEGLPLRNLPLMHKIAEATAFM